MLLTVATLALCLMEMPARAKPIVLGWGDSGDNVRRCRAALSSGVTTMGRWTGYSAAKPEAVRLFSAATGWLWTGR